MKLAIIISLFFTLSACVSNNMQYADPIEQIKNGDFNGAALTFNQTLDASGSDRLLHQLELGMLEHLRGNYQLSNQYFNEAELIAEKLYTISISESAKEMLTGANFSNYKGLIFENTFVNYYKALNHLKLAELTAHSSPEQLDSALVEIRRISLKLDALTNKTGGYQTPIKANENKALNFFSGAFGNKSNNEKLKYKDDAFIHYLSGLLYEIAEQDDSARIEYKRAANAYEKGYAAQYELDNKNIEQAWFDTIKLMKSSGGYENDWPTLAINKLTKEHQTSLKKIDKNSSELVILQHAGTAPKRQELNLILRLDHYSRSLVLTPILSGTRQQRQEQYNWFYMLYADTDLTDIIENYILGDVFTVLEGNFTKRVPLYGKLWDKAIDLELDQILTQPIRIAVPYFPSPQQNFVKTELYINGVYQQNLYKAQSIARIALQEQLNVANKEIQFALARELIKAVTAHQLTKDINNDFKAFAQFGLSLMNIMTGSADTRSWLSLPAEINFIRLPIEAGKHAITIKTHLSSGEVIEQSSTVNIKSGKPNLWHTQTYARAIRTNKNSKTIADMKLDNNELANK